MLLHSPEINRKNLASKEVRKILKKLGLKADSGEPALGEVSPRLKIGSVFHRGAKRYAVEIKSSRQKQVIFMHLLPRAILRLQAANRLGNLLSILVVVMERIVPADIQRLNEYMDLYAPEMSWLLVDEQSRAVFRDREKDRFALYHKGKVQWFESALPDDISLSRNLQISIFDHPVVSDKTKVQASQSRSLLLNLNSSRMKLSFSDLDQWLIKVFLLSPLDESVNYYGGPGEIAVNAFQLSKLAGVSPMLANEWANAMGSSGYLKRFGRKAMIPLRAEALIEEWVGRYRFSDNRLYPYRSMFPVSGFGAFYDEILANIRKYEKKLGSFAIAAHQASRLHGIKHSSARSMHIYFSGNIHEIAKAFNLVPSDDIKKADLFLVEPKYPKSVFRGIIQKEGLPVCDILQCYLDLYHLPDRGREQADQIFENVISEIIAIRQAHANRVL